MGAKIGKCGLMGQVLLVIINCVFIALGLIALIIGAWAIATESSFSFLSDKQVIGGAALLIIAGGVTIIIAVIGIFGSICKSRILLGIYALVVLAIVIVEIIAGIVAFVYRDRVVAELEMSISNTTISQYNVTSPNDANTVVDGFQKFDTDYCNCPMYHNHFGSKPTQYNFSCCGLSNASDWITLNLQAIIDNNNQPPTCPSCDSTAQNCETYSYSNENGSMISFNATTVGCLSFDSTALLALSIAAGVVGIVFGLLEIAGIVVGFLLCCCIHIARKETSA